MTDKKKAKRSGLRGMFGMMKMMRKCISGNERGDGCAAMMEGFGSGAEGFDCGKTMKAMFGAEGTKTEETPVKA